MISMNQIKLYIFAILALFHSSVSCQDTLEYPVAGFRNFQTDPDVLRGVNIGGWLVLEKWMTPDLFRNNQAVDQWSFDQTQGANATLKNHWETFFTLSDVQFLKTTGINSLRVPIGFWAYDNINTSYITGADAYLEKCLQWARMYRMKVLIDLHGVPGSQNGFDNSGKQGTVGWQTPENLARTTTVIKRIAKKYGTLQYADVVLGIELVNEPLATNGNNVVVTKSWAQSAFKDINSLVANKKLKVVVSDSFRGPIDMAVVGVALNGKQSIREAQFMVDTHLYQIWDDVYKNMTQDEHISHVCNTWAESLNLAKHIGLPVIIGEWSAVTNVCVNPDGSTTPGTSCVAPNCQCESAVPPEQWNGNVLETVRQYIEAQLDVFETYTSGYYIWSYKAPGAWGFRTGIERGFYPYPITSRKYPAICSEGVQKIKG